MKQAQWALQHEKYGHAEEELQTCLKTIEMLYDHFHTESHFFESDVVGIIAFNVVVYSIETGRKKNITK